MPKCAVVISREQGFLAFCRAALPTSDCELVFATQAETVVTTLLRAQPEVILLDLDLCREVAASILPWIGTQRPRPGLVLVGSSENLEVLREGFVVPDFQLLIKPLRKDEIQVALDAVFRHQKNAQSAPFPEEGFSR